VRADALERLWFRGLRHRNQDTDAECSTFRV
jgi:hypothetical protein